VQVNGLVWVSGFWVTLSRRVVWRFARGRAVWEMKKAPKMSPVVAHKRTLDELQREHNKMMSSVGYDTRLLKPLELTRLNEVKSQIRVLKNRLAAKQSRDKAKCYSDGLEQKATILQQENSGLRERIRFLQEMISLKSQGKLQDDGPANKDQDPGGNAEGSLESAALASRLNCPCPSGFGGSAAWQQQDSTGSTPVSLKAGGSAELDSMSTGGWGMSMKPESGATAVTLHSSAPGNAPERISAVESLVAHATPAVTKGANVTPISLTSLSKLAEGPVPAPSPLLPDGSSLAIPPTNSDGLQRCLPFSMPRSIVVSSVSPGKPKAVSLNCNPANASEEDSPGV